VHAPNQAGLPCLALPCPAGWTFSAHAHGLWYWAEGPGDMAEEDDGDAQPPGEEAEAMGEDQAEPEPEENDEGNEVCVRPVSWSCTAVFCQPGCIAQAGHDAMQ
jgi:hypothetical protein